ncbi:MAG: glycosyltransferase family 2 protein [Verrucomicrobia bacterium]|nr:glycosyltransferase family 2 protein [Verrucomicrobiota bacterium]
MKICALIPAYQEAARIAEVVRGCAQYVAEVLVVDDGSGDATAERAEQAGASVIVHKRNAGKGAAIRTGFDYVRGHDFDAVIILDADGQHDWNEIPRFVEKANETGAAVVLGNRMSDVADMPRLRRWTNRTTSRILGRLAGQRLADSQCGFRLLRASVLADLDLKTANYETESEMLLQAAWAGHRIVDLPIRTIYNEAPSHIHKVRDTWRFIRLVLRARRQRRAFRARFGRKKPEHPAPGSKEHQP